MLNYVIGYANDYQNVENTPKRIFLWTTFLTLILSLIALIVYTFIYSYNGHFCNSPKYDLVFCLLGIIAIFDTVLLFNYYLSYSIIKADSFTTTK